MPYQWQVDAPAGQMHPRNAPEGADWTWVGGAPMDEPAPEENPPPAPEDIFAGFDSLIAQMMAAEQARIARINENVDTINKAFMLRFPAYNKYEDALYGLNKGQLDDLYQDYEQQRKFALARAGTSGGSTDIDTQAEMGEIYGSGLQQSREAATTGKQDLKQADMAVKNSLVNQAVAGVDPNWAGAINAIQPVQGQQPAPNYNPANVEANFSNLVNSIGRALYGVGFGGGGAPAVPMQQPQQYPSFHGGGGGGSRYQGTTYTY